MALFAPLDGRITSQNVLPSPVTDSTAVMEIVSPGNAAAGNTYQVSLATLAIFFAGYPYLNTIEILTGATFASPFTVPTTATRILINKSIASASYLQFPLAASMLAPFPILVKDLVGNASANNITVSFTGGEQIDGQTTIVITSDFGWVTVNPNPGGGGWYQSS